MGGSETLIAYGFKPRNGAKAFGIGFEEEQSPTLTSNNNEAVLVDRKQETFDTWDGTGIAGTLTSHNANGSQRMPDKQNFNCLVGSSGLQHTVRRLTPLECERLQGFPDHWTDIGDWTDTAGKVHKCGDSQRYKAIGNSIAIPPWVYVLKNLALACGADKTMASLFDGIGGFPLIWEWLNGKGSCVWASEIEEFPIAVTKLHFPEE